MLLMMKLILPLLCWLCIQGVEGTSRSPVRWCTVSNAEYAKCTALAAAIADDYIAFATTHTTLQCIEKNHHDECMQTIDNNKADIVSLDANEIFLGGRYHSLVPIMKNVYQDGESDFYSVAVVKRGTLSGYSGLYSLRNVTACFPSVASMGGWVIPISRLMEAGAMKVADCNNYVKSASAFFAGGCAVNILADKHNPLDVYKCLDVACLAVPWAFWDGKIFHHFYLRAKLGARIDDLVDHKEPLLREFQEIKSLIAAHIPVLPPPPAHHGSPKSSPKKSPSSMTRSSSRSPAHSPPTQPPHPPTTLNISKPNYSSGSPRISPRGSPLSPHSPHLKKILQKANTPPSYKSPVKKGPHVKGTVSPALVKSPVKKPPVKGGTVSPALVKSPVKGGTVSPALIKSPVKKLPQTTAM
ncbi:uncharacterized protein LOC108673222 [Hyalella azteca]|uniref:Uncharacterized protein LOC108673222 n=1 Tax=Hyalella azteca TaxID=294128 RepID=A0A8B7NU44_HYAAZ|nr:uncharacterized protein LOC108673222 [Hyalella azteca]